MWNKYGVKFSPEKGYEAHGWGVSSSSERNSCDIKLLCFTSVPTRPHIYFISKVNLSFRKMVCFFFGSQCKFCLFADGTSSTTDGSLASEISDTESVMSMNNSKPTARLPQLTHPKKLLPDLNKRVLVNPGSEEENMVLKGIVDAAITNGVSENHERAL